MPNQSRTAQQAWLEGQSRAIALLRDIEHIPMEAMDALDQDRDGKPQTNVCFCHLVSLLDMRDQDVLGAFTAVLSHYVGNAVHGSNIDVDHVERETRAPFAWDIPRRPLRVPSSLHRRQEIENA